MCLLSRLIFSPLLLSDLVLSFGQPALLLIVDLVPKSQNVLARFLARTRPYVLFTVGIALGVSPSSSCRFYIPTFQQHVSAIISFVDAFSNLERTALPS
jgi:ABC-type uncharacterized transport system YnjBCD permease subunit